MPYSIFWHTLLSMRRALLAWGAGLVAFVLVTTAFYPALQLYPDFAIGTQLRVAGFQAWVNVRNAVMIPSGYLSTTGFSMILPLAFGVFAILQTNKIFTREAEHGLLDVFLARPLPRKQLVLAKYTALGMAVLVLCLVLWITYTWRVVALNMSLNLAKLAQASFALLLLSLYHGALALVFGTLTRKSKLSSQIALGALGLGYFFYLAPHLLPGLALLRYLNPFFYALHSDPLANGLNLLFVLCLISITAVLVTVAISTFERSDIPEYRSI
jgi:ABC-2 type transport system permease protein